MDFYDSRLFALARACSQSWTKPQPDGKIQPGLMASWSSNETGDTWTLHFGTDPAGNDTDLQAEFEQTLAQLLREDISPMRAQIADLVVGARDFAQGKAETISGLEATAEATILHLTRPHRYLPAWLSQPGLMPRPIKGGDGTYQCTGPFSITSIGPAEIKLIRNPLFKGAAARLDSLTFVCEPDYEKQVELFRAGKLDASNVPMAKAAMIEAEEALLPSVVHHETAEQLLVLFDQHQFPWGDQKFQPKTGLRQSLNWGLDRETLAVILNNQFAPYPYFFPKTFKDFIDPSLLSQPIFSNAVQTEDARKAQKEADHEQGSKLLAGMDLGNLSGADLDSLNVELLRYWKEISIRLRPFPMTGDEMRARVEAGTHELLLSRCCPAYPDPDALAYPLAYGPFSGLGGNYSMLSEESFDETIEATQSEKDPVTRRKLFQQLERSFQEHSSFVFLGYFTPTLLVSPAVRGLRLGAYDFDASLPAQDFAQLGLAPAAN